MSQLQSTVEQSAAILRTVPDQPAPLRVAVAGVGFIGRVHLAAARRAGATVVGLAASTPERGVEAAAELAVATAAATAEDLLDLDLDVLHIATPNHLHVDLAVRALQRGIHVVVEKPVALDLDGARSLLAVAKETGLVAAVPFVYRFHPVVRHARAMVEAGEIGDVRLVHGHYLQDWLMSADDTNWRVSAAAGGRSRAFADIGSHWCDLVQFVTGDPIRRLLARTATVVADRPAEARESFVTASSDGPRQRVDTEDAVTVLFETDNGTMGSLVVSQVSPGRKNRLWFEIDGSTQSVVFDQEHAETLWVGGREGARVVPRDPGLLAPSAAKYAWLPAGHAQGYGDCFDAFVADAYRAVQGDAPEGLPTIVDGFCGVALTRAVLTSAADGGWIEVETP